MAEPLVPHTLPDGRVLMVPASMAGQSAFTPKVFVPDEEPAAPAPFEQQVGSALSGGGSRVPKLQIRDFKSEKAPDFTSVGEVQTRADILKSRGAPKAASAVDPSTLAEPGGGGAPAPAEQKEGEWNPLVRQVFNEGGRGGGRPRRTGRREETSVTAERTPGKELLPELKWAMGLEARPQELDPDAAFVADDPKYRGVQTGVTMGAEQAGKSARLDYERQVNQEHARLNAEREGLVQQSQALDDNLSQVAKRRERIAALQDTADKRMEEARSFEPRTRDQVWEDKGPAAQVMGILAMALGGYVQGLGRSGGRNPGFDMVNKVLDDAVEGDRHKADKRMKIGQAARNDYEKALALYGDPEAALLEAKNRKLANVMGMTQNMLADRGLDEVAKQRGEQLYAAAQQQYLQNAQQLYDQLNGVVVKESINYKPEMAGGGGGMTLQQRLKNAAEATKNVNIITGKGAENPHQRSVEGDKLTELNKSFEAIESAEGVQSDLKALGAESSDIDDPLSGPIDAIAAAVGTGGTSRRARQSLERNTENLARGIQIGASDNDAISADKRARADGSGAGRWATAETAKRKATARIQSTLAGMSPAMRQAYLDGLPPERREFVQRLSTESTVRHRAASEKAVE